MNGVGVLLKLVSLSMEAHARLRGRSIIRGLQTIVGTVVRLPRTYNHC